MSINNVIYLLANVDPTCENCIFMGVSDAYDFDKIAYVTKRYCNRVKGEGFITQKDDTCDRFKYKE